MSPRHSLLKRAIVPLFGAATLAASLCAPAHAVTASWNTCQVVNQGTPYAGIAERVDCNFTGNARWKVVDFNTDLLGNPDPAYKYDAKNDQLDTFCGVGDYLYPTPGILLCRPEANGTYNCWCVCSGLDYYGAAWNASTGGTTFVSWSGSSH